MTDLPDRLFGMRVIVSPVLPIVPTIEQEAKWIVQSGFRKAYSDFDRWHPGALRRKPEVTHALVMRHPELGEMVMLSREALHRIRLVTAPVTAQRVDSSADDVFAHVWQQRARFLYEEGRP